jgi:hypothetical protein
MRLLPAVAVLLSATALSGEPFTCGTSVENSRDVRAAGEFVQLRQALRAGKGTAPTALANNVFTIRADDTNAPYGRPFDLAGKTVELTPAGEDAFTARVRPVEWTADRGQPLNGGATRSWNLSRPFTIFGRQVGTLYVTDRNSIHLDPPQLPGGRQIGDWELTSFRQPVISPFFLTDTGRTWINPTIHVRETSDSLLVTWESPGRLAVQAAILADGRIRFSYNIMTLPSGGLIVTSGTEGWRNVRTPLVNAADAAGDVSGSIPQGLRRMLDIESVTINRLSDLDLAEVRIQLAEAPEFARIPANRSVAWQIVAGESAFSPAAARVVMTSSGPQLRATIPVFGGTSSSPAASLEGRTLVVRLPDSFLEAAPRVTVVSRSDNGGTADVVAAQTLTLPAPSRRMNADLSAADGTTLRMPVIEAFTLAVLVPTRIWDQLHADHALREDEVDAVAIYQNFHTDIRLYAGAYALSGNPGVSGISPGDEGTAGTPREPALLHMNHLDVWREDLDASHVLLHELGHRWLYFVQIMENGRPEYSLNPASAHPAQFVHTPAAFNVHAPDDASAMGGSTFTDHQNGTFTSGSGTHNGYSWLDLYLMGLAAPEEVSPFFYIANSNPRLEDAYYAPAHTTVTGSRRNVTLQQVTGAVGPRLPAYPQTQRSFKVAFVLLTDGEPAPAQLERMQALRQLMARDFATATGGRASLTTDFGTPEPPPSGPRRRSIRH